MRLALTVHHENGQLACSLLEMLQISLILQLKKGISHEGNISFFLIFINHLFLLLTNFEFLSWRQHNHALWIDYMIENILRMPLNAFSFGASIVPQ